MIQIEKFDHIGIRITDKEKSLRFYEVLGFKLEHEVDFDAVVIMKNIDEVEINLVINGQDLTNGKNILMDVPEKHTGITHVAFQVKSILDTIATLKKHDITITQGPVTFGRDGHVSVFIRDPDRNTVELRARIEDQSKIPGLEIYDPNG